VRYLDSGSRNPADTLASWIESVVSEEVSALRLQTGFFSLDGIGLLLPTLECCKTNNLVTNFLIGSNDSSTLRDDVVGLLDALGIPRSNTQLGVVSYGGAFFHPKTYHFTRPDGSQAAFVGSANLTRSGLALHVEAGIALDTRDGDTPQHLSQIAMAIDNWFAEQRQGMTLVTDHQVVDELVANGVLTLTRPPRPTPQAGIAENQPGTPRPRLQTLVTLPNVNFQQNIAPQPVLPQAVILAPVTAQMPTTQPSGPKAGFPQYLFFAPNATLATTGAAALTGHPLPNGAAGLIVQLNRDSARHFAGRSGTANISIPVMTASTLRFGIAGVNNGPASAFDLRLRFVDDNGSINGGTTNTSVKGYGYTASETGHGDIRMVVPAAVRALANAIQTAGKTVPAADDLAFLEWPSMQDPSFKLTFLDTQSNIYQQALAMYNNAVITGQLVGKGTCWLAAGVSPIW
jgi:hypothetical protein